MKKYIWAFALIFILIMGVNIIIPSSVVQAQGEGGVVFLCLDEGKISGSNIEDMGGGMYQLIYESDDIHLSLPTPTGTNKEYLGWKLSGGNETITQITNDLNGATLYVVWVEATPTRGISERQYPKPQEDNTKYEYTGDEITYKVPVRDYYTITGNKHTEAGVYNVTISLVDSVNTAWDDGSTLDIIYTFEIHRYDITWEWEQDYSLATAHIKCESGCGLDVSMDAKITLSTTKVSTAEDYGEILYTASVVYNGETRSDTKRVNIPKLNGTLTSKRQGVSVYSSLGFKSERLIVNDVDTSSYTQLGASSWNYLAIYDIAIEGASNRAYTMTFDVSKSAGGYRDIAVIRIDDQNITIVGDEVVDNKIQFKTNTLGRFAVVGIDKTDAITTAQIAMAMASVVSLVVIALGLTIIIVIKMILINKSKLAIKRY